jgi:hypothetical protein
MTNVPYKYVYMRSEAVYIAYMCGQVLVILLFYTCVSVYRA